jgi:uncharacterized protein (TIGR03086 family)
VDRVAALVEALQLQLDVVGRIDPAGLAAGSRCPGWTVREALQHSLAVTSKFADFAAGTTDAPRTPTHDLLGGHHRAAAEDVVARATAAWAAADLARTCTLPFGTFPAEAAAGINLVDVLAHTWDVADPLGLRLNGNDELWRAGLAAATSFLAGGRDLRHYGAEVPGGEASPRTRFLRLLGRAA